mmetsp:Transcript_236/g.759  ORF Transcript_236/g.759 Transcript_236/m.759 type:complete len:94 (-) Transcript_236:1432-1713(-)
MMGDGAYEIVQPVHIYISRNMKGLMLRSAHSCSLHYLLAYKLMRHGGFLLAHASHDCSICCLFSVLLTNFDVDTLDKVVSREGLLLFGLLRTL